MKWAPLTRQGTRFLVEMIFTNEEVKLLGGIESAQLMCERACEENLRAMNARLEYLRATEGVGTGD